MAAKASKTEAVVRRRRKQRECLHGGYVSGSQWNQRGSGDGGKKAAAVVAAAAEGIWAVVSAAAKAAPQQTTAATAGQATAAETEAAAGQQQSTKMRERSVAIDHLVTRNFVDCCLSPGPWFVREFLCVWRDHEN